MIEMIITVTDNPVIDAILTIVMSITSLITTTRVNPVKDQVVIDLAPS